MLNIPYSSYLQNRTEQSLQFDLKYCTECEKKWLQIFPYHSSSLSSLSFIMYFNFNEKKKSKKKKKVVILECWNRTVLFHLNPLLCLLCAEIITSLWYSGNIFSEHTIHQELRYSLLFTVCTCQNLPIIPYIQLLIHMFLKLSEVIRQENLFFFLFKC